MASTGLVTRRHQLQIAIRKREEWIDSLEAILHRTFQELARLRKEEQEIKRKIDKLTRRYVDSND
jgi:hypothetical protein